MILGISLDNISAERKDFQGGEFKVTYSSEIKDVQEAKVSALDAKVADLRFSFDVNYSQKEKKVGSIKFEGSILWKSDPKKLQEKWKKEKKLPDEIGMPVLNNMYRKCLITGASISEQLGLPSPIPLPRVELKK